MSEQKTPDQSETASTSTAPETECRNPATQSVFPIVGIGASAGGLEATKALFAAMPSDTGMAFVLVVHLDPQHSSLMAELLQKDTELPVCQIEDGMSVAPDHVYVIPPNKSLSISRATLRLSDVVLPRAANLPIDSFFQSLATDQEKNAVGIILSGTGSDGSLGLLAIKRKQGMVMVQDDESAKFNGMPLSAISTGVVDYVLPPDKMPAQLIQYTLFARNRPFSQVSHQLDAAPYALNRIIAILRARTNHDFSMYKENTILRRIERRLNIHQIENISQYVSYLQENEHETTILFKELRIGVTHFFRDPDAFKTLQSETIPALFAEKPNDYAIRVWVPGCASGEEAYSIAILLHESMEQCERHFQLQVFGTDVNEEAIHIARAGIYPDSIQTEVGEERLKRYFIRQDDGRYRVNKLIREILVFAPQNIIANPPFTRLDMLSCRNLLIYLNAELQQRLLPMFHYSLKPDGILFLGSSESIGHTADLFVNLHCKWKIYRRKDSGGTSNMIPRTMPFLRHAESIPSSETAASANIRQEKELNALQLMEIILNQSNAPPCAIINERFDIVYIHGRLGLFLEPAEGKTSVNIVEMARPELKSNLAAGIQQVAFDKREVVYNCLQIESSDLKLCIKLTIRPVLAQTSMREMMIVMFETIPHPSNEETIQENTDIQAMHTSSEHPRIAELEQELRYHKYRLQTTIEELEASNEELRSTNEELQSTNEELQSTNEELETSKEEMQSLNEETSIVNAELQGRIEELTTINDDMKNLLDSTDIATIFLDTQLCVRRYSPLSLDIIPLTGTDIGRPIHHLSSSLLNVNIADYGQRVLSDLSVREIEADSNDGRRYVMRVRPYRTVANVIDGVVVTFEDVTARVQAELALRESERIRRLALEVGQIGVFEVDLDTGEGMWSNEISNMWDFPEGCNGDFISLCWSKVHPEDISRIQLKFERLVESGEVGDLEFRLLQPGGDMMWIRWRCQVVETGVSLTKHFVGVSHDITAQKKLEEKLRAVQDTGLN